MKGIQHARSKVGEENVFKTSKCPCPANRGYARKSDRPPLGNIQDSAVQPQYLTVDHGQTRKVTGKSKSLSSENYLSPFTYPSSGSKHIQVLAESTKISPTPPIKPFVTELPPTITVRSTQKPELQKRVIVPVRARSYSCRCPATKAVKERDIRAFNFDQGSYGNSNDDVFLLRSSTPAGSHSKTSNKLPQNISKISLSSTQQSIASHNGKHFYDSQLQLQGPQSRELGSIQKRSSSSNQNTGIAKRPSIQISPSVSTIEELGFSSTRISDYSSKSTISQLSSLEIQKTRTAQTSTQSSISSRRTQGSSGVTPTIRQSTPNVSPLRSQQNFSSARATNQSTRSKTRPDQISGSYATLSTQNFTTLSQNSLQATSKSCSAKYTSQENSHKYVTLPAQYFVTLTQDTLQTTQGSEASGLRSIQSKLGKVQLVRDTSIFPDDEKTFIDATKFIQELEQGKCSTTKKIPVYSPLEINVPIRRSNSISDAESTRKPAVKTTLRRRNSIKKTIIYPLLYSPEYIEDIITYSGRLSNNFILKPEVVNTYMDRRYRTVTVNWMLQVSEVVSPNVEPVYYTAVRIFDYTVVTLKLRKGHYQLAAIVAYWISTKYHDDSISLRIPKIYSLCKGQYSKAQILSMERNILKSIHFYLDMADPLDFLHYDLKKANLENHELLKHGSQFVMECATLFESYSLIEPHFISASAIYLACKTLSKDEEVDKVCLGFDRKQIKSYADRVLGLNVKYTIHEQYEPLTKYLTMERMKVALHFLHNL